MPTTYYLRKVDLRTCKGEELLLGQSTNGWCFSLHRLYDKGIEDLSDWIDLLRSDDWRIFDDKDKELSIEEMLTTIIDRRAEHPSEDPGFYASKKAVPGPNGLLRHRLNPLWCMRHGEGAWDLMTTDFFEA